MSALDRKLRRDVVRMWGTLLAITGIMAIGVACLVAMSFSYRNLTAAKNDYYAQCRMGDFSIDLKKLPNAELEAIGRMEGVESLRGRIRFYAVVDAPDAIKPLSGMVLSMPDERRATINDIVLRQGGYFSDRRENEVIVNDAFAREHGLRPGQWIHLLLNNRRQELFIVGTAVSSEYVYLLGPGAIAPDPKTFGVFYIKRTYAEDVFDFDGACNEIIGRLSPTARGTPRLFLRRAEEHLDSYGVSAATPLADQASNKYLSQEIEGLYSFAFFLPSVFLAVAALVLNILLRRLVDSQRTVIGTLKAIGYGDRQVFWHYIQFGLVVGIVGAALGLALGAWMASAMTSEYKHFFEFPDLRSGFYVDIALIATAVTLLCSIGGAAWSARSVLRLNPAAAMRPKPPRSGGGVGIDRIGWLWSRLSPSWRLVVRSMIREPGRTLTSIVATALGAGLLVSGLMMVEATVYLLDFQFKWIQRSDISLSLKDPRGIEALDEIRRLPGVDAAEPVLHVGCKFRSGPYEYKGGVIGLPRNPQLTVPRDPYARRIPVPETGLVMNRKLAEILHVGPGDAIEFRPVKGLRRTHRTRVAAITDSFVGTAVYADIDYLARLVGEERIMTGVELATDRDPANEAELYRRLKRMPALRTVLSRRDMIADLEETLLGLLWVSIGMLVMFAGAVFFGTILNASLVGLEQRRREIGTLYVLGYGPWEIGWLVLRETLATSLIGAVVGMPIGYGLTVLTSHVYNSEMFRFPVVSSAWTWIGTIVVAVLFTLTAHAVVQRIIHRADWLEALQAKE